MSAAAVVTSQPTIHVYESDEIKLRVEPTDTTKVAKLRLLRKGLGLWTLVFGCGVHNFRFPQTLREYGGKRVEYPTVGGVQYDAHQTCNKCGVSRLVRFHEKDATGRPKEMLIGQLFKFE